MHFRFYESRQIWLQAYLPSIDSFQTLFGEFTDSSPDFAFEVICEVFFSQIPSTNFLSENLSVIVQGLLEKCAAKTSLTLCKTNHWLILPSDSFRIFPNVPENYDSICKMYLANSQRLSVKKVNTGAYFLRREAIFFLNSSARKFSFLVKINMHRNPAGLFVFS